MAKTFPADFYVTCATVIPVLFLALVVQGGTYESMLRTALEAAHRQPMRSRDGAVATLLPLIPYFALMSGVLGEAAALSALFSGSDTKTGRTAVLVMTLTLVIAAAAAPTWRWFKVDDEIRVRLRQTDRRQDE